MRNFILFCILFVTTVPISAGEMYELADYLQNTTGQNPYEDTGGRFVMPDSSDSGSGGNDTVFNNTGNGSFAGIGGQSDGSNFTQINSSPQAVRDADTKTDTNTKFFIFVGNSVFTDCRRKNKLYSKKSPKKYKENTVSTVWNFHTKVIRVEGNIRKGTAKVRQSIGNWLAASGVFCGIFDVCVVGNRQGVSELTCPESAAIQAHCCCAA